MAIRVQKPPLVVITGPTASGKSALALRLAEQTDGVIVNADSAQLYRDLQVLSAAPGPSELSRAEHRLFGVLDGARACSAAQWAALARSEIADIHSAERLPILVGGTGLYLRTLLEGIAPVPPIDPAVRASVRETSVAENRARLALLDPDAAERLESEDRTRIARALEVVLSTGRTLSSWQQNRSGGIGELVDLAPIILLPPRDWLYRRCDERFLSMVEGGAREEVEALLARNLSEELPVMRAIGVREIASWVRGEASREDAIATGQQSTRRYAKRQYTWLAHQPPAHWPRFAHPPEDGSIEGALALLRATG